MNQNLIEFYSNYDENSRLDTRYGAVEFLTTMHYIRKYLKPGMRVLEIGAGTGRYSHALAQQGWQVDAVVLVPHNIDVFREHTLPDEPVTVVQGNALDLSMFGSSTYDITLLLGPMYHLYTKEDQQKALAEAIRVTKKGGIVFAAYCMGDASLLLYGFRHGKIHELLEKCAIDPEAFDGFSRPWDLFQLYRTEDIESLRSRFAVTKLHLVAADGYANYIREQLAEMDAETYELFIKYHLATCERQDLLGYSNHTLDIFRKENGGNTQ